MGGCATKPKVSMNGDAGEPLAPEPADEEAVAVVASETKAVESAVAVPVAVEKKDEVAAAAEVVVAKGGGEYTKGMEEIVVEDEKMDDQASKRRSLSLLFNKEVIFVLSDWLSNDAEKVLSSFFFSLN